MEWTQLATFIVVNLGFNITLWLWSRSESRSDLKNFSNEIRSWKEEINKEMKDFHGRLCAIEERRLR